MPDLPLPAIFGFLTALSLLIYIVLDGYDLGVGILSVFADECERNTMIATIAPFWDANETWLILAGGLVLTAFPLAQGVIFGALYAPTTILLVAILFRGVAFDFRSKAKEKNKTFWNVSLFAGSLAIAAAQGYMLGMFVTGFRTTWLVALATVMAVLAYCLVGAAWLIMKTGGGLRTHAGKWGIGALRLAIVSILAWVAVEYGELAVRADLMPFIYAGGALAVLLVFAWRHATHRSGASWLPFVLCILLFADVVAAISLYCYPYIVYGQMTLEEGAASEEALLILLAGALVTLPLAILYSVVAYRIFHGRHESSSCE